jgi:tetratricopeptide (TPR) repeat protein
MKKVTFLLLAVLVTFCANAQKKMIKSAQNALDNKDILKAWQDIQAAANNEETKNDPKTYYVMGTILQELAAHDSIYNSNPEFAKISENPAVDAYANYKKSLSLDKKFRNDINFKLQSLSNIANNKAGQNYDVKNYDKALKNFELILEINKEPIFKGYVDTMVIYNAGITAMNAKQYDKAIDLFKQAVSLGYNGGVSFSWLRQAYMSKGDTAQAVVTMQQAYQKYPKDISVLVDLVNYYLSTNQTQQAFDFLAKAKEQDPTNASFYFVEGNLLEKMNRVDDAVKAYQKAIEISPNNADAYSYLGALYFNQGVALNNKATDESNNDKYNALIKQRDEQFTKGLPYMEKAHQLNPKDQDIARNLKSFYVQLQLTDKLNALKQEMGQ